MYKRFHLIDDIFEAEFVVQIEGCPQKATDYFTAYTQGSDHTLRKINRGGLFIENDIWKGGLIWIKDKLDISSLSHECLHAVHYVLRQMRIELTEGSEEVFCYYHQWLIDSICRKAKLKMTVDKRK